MKKYYYLAYGSNLNVDQMETRCPTALAVGTAVLKGWRLSFKGSKTGSYLTIDPCPGAETPVGVWEVYEEDVRNLDRYEGYPIFYERKVIPVAFKSFRTGKTRTVKAFVYAMTGNRQIGFPTNRYMTTCMIGYRDFGFDRNCLIEAYRRCEGVLKREA